MTDREVVTGGQAWEALGADAAYAPKRPAKPASGAQLFACNLLGLLELRRPEKGSKLEPLDVQAVSHSDAGQESDERDAC